MCTSPDFSSLSLSLLIINQVDTVAENSTLVPIHAAYKPSLNVTFSCDNPITFGAMWDKTANKFDADNIGITPLLKQANSATHLHCDISFVSWALPGDHMVDATNQTCACDVTQSSGSSAPRPNIFCLIAVVLFSMVTLLI